MSGERPEHRAPEFAPDARPSTASRVGALPQVDGMRRWLLSDAILARDGAILSWANPRSPGYAYPEAAGLFLSTLSTAAWRGTASATAADRVAAWLCRSLGPDGGAGRAGVAYLFDSAVALVGLLRYRAAGGRAGGDAAVHRLQRFVCAQISAGTGVLPRRAALDGRWSTQFGSHLLKCLQSLYLYARTFGAPAPHDDLVAALIERSGRQPSPVYVHPFCYEQEGHLVIGEHAAAVLAEPVEGALELLAALQQPDGSILAFANGMEGFGEPRTDATAQAVRLWLMRDRRRYAESIAAALAFLASCQTADGGIRYAPGRDDVCSWSTMFTLQAVEWFLERPHPDELL